MAVGDIRLSTNRYVRPGAYVGRVPQPQAVNLSGHPRFPCFVGRTNRLKRVADAAHVRARVYDETLNFSTVAPYIAFLDHNAVNDKSLAQIITSDGEPLSTNYWAFLESDTEAGVYDRVIIDETVYDKNKVYLITYQSSDRDVLDPMTFDDVRRVIAVGDSPGHGRYVEFVDYRIDTGLIGDTSDSDALIINANNKYPSSSYSSVTITGTGTAAVTISSSSEYSYNYSRDYLLTAGNTSGTSPNAIVELTIEVSHLSGGNSAMPNVPFHSSGTASVVKIEQNGYTGGPIPLKLDNNNVATPYVITWLTPMPSYWEYDGITLEIDFGASNFVDGDTISYKGYGPGLIEFSSAHDNSNQFSHVNTPAAASTNTSSGKFTVSSKTDYDDEYDRSYYLEVSAASGSFPTRQATIRWAGHKELPFSEGEFTVNENVPSTYQDILLEKGIYIDLTWGPEHGASDTTNSLSSSAANSLASAIALATEIKQKYNGHDSNNGGAYHTTGSLHQVNAADPIDFATLVTLALDIQTNYTAHLNDSAEHQVADTLNAISTTISSSSSLSDIVAFLNEVRTSYEAHRVLVGFVDGDRWTIEALAPRREYTAKDERSYDITINSVVPDSSITFTYHTGTYEGWWGTGTLSANGGSWVDINADFPDGIRLMFRNLEDTERFDANDKFSFSTVCNDLVDWSLVRRSVELISSSDIRQDALGTVTGIPLSYYIVLDETPTSILRVENNSTGDVISYSHISETPYISFSSNPNVDIKVKYEWRGYEPDPGNSYFITADRLRRNNEYDTAIRLLGIDEARAELYPTSVTNHLWIAAEIAFETNMFGCYVVPVRSASGDEQFTLADYKRAINASEYNSEITDLVVLSYFDALGHAKTFINNINDPFKLSPRLLWVGAPRGTPIGDENTPDTLVYLARTTLQFGPQEAGKGNVILIGNTTCSRTLQLEDGSTTSVDLDGSFIAAYAAAKTAEFTDPASTLLRTTTSSFSSIQEYTEKEEELLGAASITFLSSVGSGIYQFAESVTVDTTEVALNEISARTQEHYVLRRVTRELDEALTGFVPPSAAAGQILIQSQLVRILGSMASSNIIAPYGTESAPYTPRQIDPSKDVYVFVDENDQRLYHFGYYFVTRLPIKRMFGLYSVNTRFWATGADKTGAA